MRRNTKLNHLSLVLVLEKNIKNNSSLQPPASHYIKSFLKETPNNVISCKGLLKSMTNSSTPAL